jgi:hypothetical protein
MSTLIFNINYLCIKNHKLIFFNFEIQHKGWIRTNVGWFSPSFLEPVASSYYTELQEPDQIFFY